MDGADLKKILLAWLALPLTALDWAVAWSRLPERVPMHFGPDGRATSWATRGEAMRFDLVLLGGVLLFATVVGFLVAFTRPGTGGPRGAMAVLVVGGFVFLVVNWILWRYQVA
jgi:hypothetical protein